MNSLAKKFDCEFIATNIGFTEDQIHVALYDGREKFEIIGFGTGIH
jgi:hypothetical protein